jgi:Tol biopolymer transport system component
VLGHAAQAQQIHLTSYRDRHTIDDVLRGNLGRYSIKEKLGDGGMGVIYEAVDRTLGRAVALKVLPADFSADTARNQRFLQEAKAASALSHPNIVTIYEIAELDGVCCIAMELIRGRTLEQVLSGQKAALPDILKYATQIADAMSAAHDAGIVHRDLKPSNIMINERGDVKVVDFGLARLTAPEKIEADDETQTVNPITQEGSVMGTAPYMSPEQVEGQRVDARTDIFSLGALLYEMATGRSPFARPSLVATFAAVLKDEPQPASAVVDGSPTALDRVISGCLAKDRQERTQSMAEVLRQLRGIERGTQTDRPVLFAPTRARSPFVYAAAVLGIFLAVAAGAIAVRYLRRPAAGLFQATVLTTFVGEHGSPSLSPDGSQFVFAWDGDVPNGPLHLYLSLVGKGTPLRLTPEGENDEGPSWSPDGQSIAFVEHKNAKSHSVAVIPALGGAERRIADAPDVSSVSWSPDSRWLVWCQGVNASASISIAPAGGGEVRTLIGPGTAKAYSEAMISPEGNHLVFSQVAGDLDVDLYVAGFHDGHLIGKPRQLTFDHNSKYLGAWTDDGVLYVAGNYQTSAAAIWRIPVLGGVPQLIAGIGTNASALTYSRKAHRLVYSTLSVNFDIHRLELSNPKAKPERFLSSNRFEANPSYSPDGKRIAFDSNRGGTREIWVADATGTNASPVTSFHSGVSGSGRWSPDGQLLVFDARPGSNADVYVVPATGGPVKKLTDFPGEDHNGIWSADGKWIYFASRRLGPSEIFRMHADGSGVQQMTKNGGILPSMGPDGKWLYYTASGKGLWKMPSDGGPAVQVLTHEQVPSNYGYTVTPQGIYALAAKGANAYSIVFYPFGRGNPRTIIELDRPIFLQPAVSPDARYLLYTTADDPVFEIMLVDNFR